MNCYDKISIIPVNCGDTGNHPPGVACDDGTVNSYWSISITTVCTGRGDQLVHILEDSGDNSNNGGGTYSASMFLNPFLSTLTPEQLLVYNSNPSIEEYLVNNLIVEPNPNYNPLLGGDPNNVIIKPEAEQFVTQLIDQSILNPTLNFDVNASANSTANIDRSAINNNTPEGQKFNEIYDELANLPEFKAIFIDIFNSDGTRPNVKFVIEEHVYSLDNPNNAEVNATTNGTNPNFYLIKINKQCLLPNTTKSQADIEIAKTIAHEAMHAYLYFNINNPVFANISMPDLLDELINIDANQHDFIFTNLAPKLGAILSALKDVLTTPTQRAIVENMPMYAVQNPQSVPITWNWNTYFTYLGYQGLEESEGFKALFPPGSNALYIYTQYMAIGHYNL